MTTRTWLLAAGLVLGSVRVAAQQPAPARLSLADALGLAEQRSEPVGIARAGAERAAADERQARSALLPQLNASASYQRILRTQFSRFIQSADSAGSDSTGQGNTLPFGQPNTWNLGLSLSQTVYDAAVLGRNRSAAAAARASRLAVGGERARTLLDVATAYYDAALADRLLAIAESTLAQAERTLRDARLGEAAGVTSEFDRLRAEVARDNAKPPTLTRAVRRDQAYVRLKQLLDFPVDLPLELATSLDDEPAGVLPPTAADLTAGDTLPETRLPVRQAGEEVRAQEGLLDAARGEALPALVAGSDFARIGFGAEPVPPWNSFVDDWNISVRLRVPLFTGGRLKGTRLAAEAGVQQSRLRLKLAQELAARDNRLIVSLLRAAEADLAATTGTVGQARRAYQIAELRFREGLSTQTELADARLQLQQAEANRAQAARELQVARLRVLLLPSLPLGTADASLAAIGAAPVGSAPAATTTISTQLGR